MSAKKKAKKKSVDPSERNAGVLILLTHEEREAFKNLVDALAREARLASPGQRVSQSSVMRSYLTRDPQFLAELRRIKNAKRKAKPAPVEAAQDEQPVAISAEGGE
jgi:hypothetical protein